MIFYKDEHLLDTPENMEYWVKYSEEYGKEEIKSLIRNKFIKGWFSIEFYENFLERIGAPQKDLEGRIHENYSTIYMLLEEYRDDLGSNMEELYHLIRTSEKFSTISKDDVHKFMKKLMHVLKNHECLIHMVETEFLKLNGEKE